ncbi:MAG: hypothetical protein P1U34_01565 [Coxiellaceae bacterium]|nr:hypothetical protein [Coxiellaceae bacterium]
MSRRNRRKGRKGGKKGASRKSGEISHMEPGLVAPAGAGVDSVEPGVAPGPEGLSWEAILANVKTAREELFKQSGFNYLTYRRAMDRKSKLPVASGNTSSMYFVKNSAAFYQDKAARIVPILQRYILALRDMAHALESGPKPLPAESTYSSALGSLRSKTLVLHTIIMEFSNVPGGAWAESGIEALIDDVTRLIRIRTETPASFVRRSIDIIKQMMNHPKPAIRLNCVIPALYQAYIEYYFTLINTPADKLDHKARRDAVVNIIIMLDLHAFIQGKTTDDNQAVIDRVVNACKILKSETDEILTKRLVNYIDCFVSDNDFSVLFPWDDHIDIHAQVSVILNYICATPVFNAVDPAQTLWSHLHKRYKGDAERSLLNSYLSYMKNSAKRQGEYRDKAGAHEAFYQQEQQAYLTGQQEIQQQKQAKERELRLHLDRLMASAPRVLGEDEEKGEDYDESDEERAFESGVPLGRAASKVITKNFFPLLRPEYESQCCRLHLDLMQLARITKKQLAVIFRDKSGDFSELNAQMKTVHSVVDFIEDIDSNHRAQKLLFMVGMHLQVTYGYILFLSRLEFQLETVAGYTREAMDLILAFQETDLSDLADEYQGLLDVLIDEVGLCHQRLVQAAERNYNHTQQILAHAQATRQRKFEQSGIKTRPKPRHEWHPSTRTNEHARKAGLIDGDGVSAAFVDMTVPVGRAGRERGRSTLFTAPRVRPGIKLMHKACAKVAKAKAQSTATRAPVSVLSPTDWFMEQGSQAEVLGQGIVYENPTFLAIMQALNHISPDLARRMRVQGGQLRDFLLLGKSDGDWDMRYFGTLEQLQRLLPIDMINIISTGEGALLQTKVPLTLAGGEVILLDITVQPCADENVEYLLTQPSNTDFDANGLYSFQLKSGKHVILNHEGSSDPAAVMASAQAPLDVISSVSIENDPLLILRALKMQGQFKYDVVEALLDQLTSLQSAFDITAYPESTQNRFVAYLQKHHDVILGANLLILLPELGVKLHDLYDSTQEAILTAGLGFS